MSKKEKTPVVALVPEVEQTVTSPDVAPPLPKLLDVDRLALDLAKERRVSAQSEVKLAQSKGETAELAFRYVVLQLYMKYGLSSSDALNENGDIVIGGAAQAQQAQ